MKNDKELSEEDALEELAIAETEVLNACVEWHQFFDKGSPNQEIKARIYALKTINAYRKAAKRVK